jgi:hypothetical protein
MLVASPLCWFCHDAAQIVILDNRRDRRDSHREEEPEWFSSGPISKSDTIELHGFERDRRDSDRQKEDRGNDAPKVKQKEIRKQQVHQHIQEHVEVSDEDEKRDEGKKDIDLTFDLCHQYLARPACTSVQSDQALYIVSLLKFYVDVFKIDNGQSQKWKLRNFIKETQQVNFKILCKIFCMIIRKMIHIFHIIYLFVEMLSI